MAELQTGATASVTRSCGLEHATVAVLMGGRSSEREVSLASGRMVLTALTTPTHGEDRRGPARVIAVEILADGRWRIGKRTLLAGEAVVALADVDLCFSALHGGEGENGALQGLLTCSDQAFTGSGVIASALAMDKVFARELVRVAGLRVAPAATLRRATWRAQAGLAELLAQGAFVKPRRGGSSVGCALVRSQAELEAALEPAFAEGPEVLLEARVRGVEATAAVLETPEGELLALPPVEIRPRGGFFDYREKYAEDGALELCPPVGLDPRASALLCARARAAHEALGCAGYSRSDFIVPEGEDEPVFLELNTLPGLTPRSLLPKSAAAAGIDYRTLCLWIAARGLAHDAGRRLG
ncbi:MAG TPA: D-alanine--D-alanine ligase [Planctomycetota bacterium]